MQQHFHRLMWPQPKMLLSELKARKRTCFKLAFKACHVALHVSMLNSAGWVRQKGKLGELLWLCCSALSVHGIDTFVWCHMVSHVVSSCSSSRCSSTLLGHRMAPLNRDNVRVEFWALAFMSAHVCSLPCICLEKVTVDSLSSNILQRNDLDSFVSAALESFPDGGFDTAFWIYHDLPCGDLHRVKQC